MATTKDRQEQLINAERELRDHDVVALERLRVATSILGLRRG
jgi:hypothetical protein